MDNEKLKHTPAPWKVVLNNPCTLPLSHTIKQDDSVECPIANLWVGGGTRGKPRQIANARLILKAPEMLEALIKIYEAQVSSKATLANLNGAISQTKLLIEEASGVKIEELMK